MLAARVEPPLEDVALDDDGVQVGVHLALGAALCLGADVDEDGAAVQDVLVGGAGRDPGVGLAGLVDEVVGAHGTRGRRVADGASYGGGGGEQAGLPGDLGRAAHHSSLSDEVPVGTGPASVRAYDVIVSSRGA